MVARNGGSKKIPPPHSPRLRIPPPHSRSRLRVKKISAIAPTAFLSLAVTAACLCLFCVAPRLRVLSRHLLSLLPLQLTASSVLRFSRSSLFFVLRRRTRPDPVLRVTSRRTSPCSCLVMSRRLLSLSPLRFSTPLALPSAPSLGSCGTGGVRVKLFSV